ncbi:MAG: M48 family metallopeptidase [Vicinamibacterales bacterium]
MTTERRHIEVGGILVEVIRREIKHLHVGVYPPRGRVRVAAPRRLSDDAVRLAVVSRLAWIRRKRRDFEQQDRQSQRELITGESHYFLGRRYRLDVVEGAGRPGVHLPSNVTMRLHVRRGADREERDAVLQRWYRRRLREQLPALVAKWEPRVGRTIADVRIKRMKTRWGSCNAQARRVWLNLELAKKPVGCLEYLLVHEMVHLIERHHTDRFRELMDGLMPSWRTYRDELNRAPLAHEEWPY